MRPTIYPLMGDSTVAIAAISGTDSGDDRSGSGKTSWTISLACSGTTTVVLVCAETPSGTSSISACTVDGNAATAGTQVQQGEGAVRPFIIATPSTGALDVVITTSSGVQSVSAAVICFDDSVSIQDEISDKGTSNSRTASGLDPTGVKRVISWAYQRQQSYSISSDDIDNTVGTAATGGLFYDHLYIFGYEDAIDTSVSITWSGGSSDNILAVIGVG